MQKKKQILNIIKYIFFFIIVCFASLAIALCNWASTTFNVRLNAIINTMLSSLQGTSQTTILPAVRACIPWVLLAIGILVLYIGLEYNQNKKIENCDKRKKRKKDKREKETQKMKFLNFWFWGGAIVYLIFSIYYVQDTYDFIGYFKNRNEETSLYADRYVDPRLVEIRDGGQKRNLIYIYLESMENTYADMANGGIQEINYIPNLTKLAQENISFSPKDGLGGFQGTDGAGWTMGALFATTSGVPFEFPVGNNDMDQHELFATGIYSLGDFLEDQGYNQMFLCGSNGAFAGRKKYFKQHGNYNVYDYGKAIRNEDIPQGYKVWWGFEDAKLYEIAKEKLAKLAAKEEPFNLTMLTVDTHHIGGYVCQLCGGEYEDDTANVVSCADRQVGEFVEWIKQQDFYENTTIVITGDHPRMDNHLVEGIDYNDRLIYNCYINTVHDKEAINQKRQSTGMDVFPTVLSAMGYEIAGGRLGLGADLFAGETTLVEEMGLQALDAELMKTSRFYIENFAPELSYLIEDEFDSLHTIYFYGNDFNADHYVKSPIIQAEIASWVCGDHLEVDVPVECEDGDVTIKIHIQETYNGSQRLQLYQKNSLVAEKIAPGNCMVEFQSKIEGGHCCFTILLPDAVSAHDLDAANPDETKLSLLLNSITVNEL